MTLHRPLRVLIGAVEVARQVHDLATGFRELGHQVTTLVETRNRFYEDLTYDVVAVPELSSPDPPGTLRDRATRAFAFRFIGGANKARLLPPFERFDLYVFQFGASLFPRNRDYSLIKRSKARLVCAFLGTDIRYWSATEPRRREAGLLSYEGYRDGRSLERALRTLRMAERYADVLLFQPSYGELAVRPYNHLYLAMDTSRYEFRAPKREVPRIVHAPSNRLLKGTAEILKCLERLERDGYRFDLRLLENMPNQEVLRELTNADIVADELNEAHYGMLALEGMASGCAVGAGNRPDLVPLPRERPVVHLSPDNLYEQLRRLITDVPFRHDLAVRGRAFVREYHHHTNVAQGLLDVVSEGRVPDYYPTYFARHFRAPPEESISPRLQRLTAEVVKRHGLPQDVDPDDLTRRGLMQRLDSDGPQIPRWPPGSTDARW